MLGALGDDVVAFSRRVQRRAQQRDVIRLCRSAGEVDLTRARVEQ